MGITNEDRKKVSCRVPKYVKELYFLKHWSFAEAFINYNGGRFCLQISEYLRKYGNSARTFFVPGYASSSLLGFARVSVMKWPSVLNYNVKRVAIRSSP